MAITVSCGCGKQFQVENYHAGRPVRCPYCAGVLDAPHTADPVQPRAEPSPSRATPAWASTSDFFLTAGRVICFLGCVVAVVKTVNGLTVMEQVAGIINVSSGNRFLMVVGVLLDGFIWFCISAALVVVFTRVQQLK